MIIGNYEKTKENKSKQKNGNSKREIKQPCMNMEVYYTDQESKRGTPNLLDETIHSIMVFKINMLFVLWKEEWTNNQPILAKKIYDIRKFQLLKKLWYPVKF